MTDIIDDLNELMLEHSGINKDKNQYLEYISEGVTINLSDNQLFDLVNPTVKKLNRLNDIIIRTIYIVPWVILIITIIYGMFAGQPLFGIMATLFIICIFSMLLHEHKLIFFKSYRKRKILKAIDDAVISLTKEGFTEEEKLTFFKDEYPRVIELMIEKVLDTKHKLSSLGLKYRIKLNKLEDRENDFLELMDRDSYLTCQSTIEDEMTNIEIALTQCDESSEYLTQVSIDRTSRIKSIDKFIELNEFVGEIKSLKENSTIVLKESDMINSIINPNIKMLSDNSFVSLLTDIENTLAKQISYNLITTE